MTLSVAARLADPMARPHRPLDMQIWRSASISPCATYRWSLHRRWDGGAEALDAGLILPWIMLNPSTADGILDDPTLRRIIGFSWRWGFDGLLVVNLFPFRSPHPAALRDWLRSDERQDWDAPDALQQNADLVAKLLETHDAAMAAWGSPTGGLGYDVETGSELLLDTINDPEAPPTPGTRKRVLKLFCLAGTGAPTHPMAPGRHRVADDQVPRPIGRYPSSVTAAPFEVPA